MSLLLVCLTLWLNNCCLETSTNPTLNAPNNNSSSSSSNKCLKDLLNLNNLPKVSKAPNNRLKGATLRVTKATKVTPALKGLRGCLLLVLWVSLPNS